METPGGSGPLSVSNTPVTGNDSTSLDGFTSRKFIITCVSIGLIVSVPILYRYLGLSDSIILFVDGAIATASGVYHVANVIAGNEDKK